MRAALSAGAGAALCWPELAVRDPLRVVDAASGCTRDDLRRFGEQVAPWLLPQLAGRTLGLVRAPGATQGPGAEVHIAWAGELLGVRRRATPHAGLEIDCEEGLLHALLDEFVEFRTGHCPHPPGPGHAPVPNPDRLVLALWPGARGGWAEVAEAALRARHALHELGLSCQVKTSGSTGLHLVLPLQPCRPWPEVHAAAEALAAHLCRQWPGPLGLQADASAVWVDWRANGREGRLTAAYSPCARPGLGVSVPIRWGELTQLHGADHWHVFSLAHRLVALEGADPWAEAPVAEQGLGDALRALGFPVPCGA